MDLTILIALALISIALVGLSWFSGTDAPYVPTAQEKIVDLLKTSGLKTGKIFYELGSGDGRVVLEAARLGSESFGVEQSWLRVWYSRLIAWRQKLPNAHFFHGNLFDRAYFPADVVFVYLLPIGVNKLEEKLRSELKKGSIVITQAFHFPNWKPYKKILNKTKNDKIGGEFWLYKV